MKTDSLLILYAPLILLIIFILNNALTRSTADTENPVYLIIRFKVAQDSLTEFSQIMVNVDSNMETETGFIAAKVYQNQDDPLAFTLLERWQSRTHHQHHFDSIVASGDWQSILTLLQDSPEMSYFTEL